MDRRNFLVWSGFVTASVATTGLAGCGGGGSDTVSAEGFPDAPMAAGTGWKFPQSIASGDPQADAILLWTRVVPVSADNVVTAPTEANFGVRVMVTEVSNESAMGTSSALMGNLVVDYNAASYAQFDNTVRHRVSGLMPGRTYYYQFQAGDVRSRVGRFKTAPARDADLAQLKFAIMTCQDWTINHWAAYTDVATENLDFVVHLGDYIYETVGEAFQKGAVESRHTALSLPDGAFKTGTSGARYATSTADYRYLYKTYRTDSRMQAVHERFALIPIWDDHEFSDDCWQDAETYTDGSFNATTGAADNNRQTSRRRSANQAWFEYMPADIVRNTRTSGIDTITIYRDLQFGKLAHLVMTDERLYRADHILSEAAISPLTGKATGSVGTRYVAAQTTLYGVEAQKIAAAGGSLAPVSMLGATQRDWWKDKMKNSSATWKLWGNEVSLLRMGLDGTSAIGTLLALNSISTLATSIGSTAAAAGSVVAAAAVVAAATAGASQTLAIAGATAIATNDAGAASTDTSRAAAAVAAGLNAAQAGIAVAAFNAAKSALPAGATAAATAAAQTIAFGFIKPDILARKAASPFVLASGQQAGLAPFFDHFLFNADQWDGFDAERRDLMKFLKDNGIRNVVAVTGDIHAFFAGTVHDDYRAANGGTPVMVDLVTAGVSSDSFFSYLRDAVGALSASLSTLVYYPLAIPVPGVGTLNINANLLDYTMGKATPTVDSLAEGLRVQVRGALAAVGLPEPQLDGTTTAVLGGLKADAAFKNQLLPLAQQLASLNSNPWLKFVNTDAQGYAVITVTANQLSCEFRQVNRLVSGNQAPTSNMIAKTTTATVKRDVPAVTVV